MSKLETSAGLPFQLIDCSGICPHQFRQKFQGDFALKFVIPSQPHHPHGAAAKLLPQNVTLENLLAIDQTPHDDCRGEPNIPRSIPTRDTRCDKLRIPLAAMTPFVHPSNSTNLIT